MFERHGTIVEVVLLKDKRTGERQGIFSLYELLGVVYLLLSLSVKGCEELWVSLDVHANIWN